MKEESFCPWHLKNHLQIEIQMGDLWLN